MRTVDDFAEIRRLHRDGLSGRQIARRLGVGRDTVRNALINPEPRPYTLATPRPAPTFGPFQAVVDAIVAADAVEACVYAPGAVDKYQTVAFDGNRYSVPRRHAFQPVTVKGFVDRVEVVDGHPFLLLRSCGNGFVELVRHPDRRDETRSGTLDVFAGTAFVSSCEVRPGGGGGLTFTFRVAAKYAARSKFTFEVSIGRPGTTYYWFYLDDFVGPKVLHTPAAEYPPAGADAVPWAELSPDGQLVACYHRRRDTLPAAAAPGTLAVYAVGQTKPLFTAAVNERAGPNTSVAAFSADGTRVAVWGAGKGIDVVSARTGRPLATVELPGTTPESVDALAFSPDGRKLAVSSGVLYHKDLSVFDAVTGKRLGQPLGDVDGAASQLVFSADGTRLVANHASAVYLVNAVTYGLTARYGDSRKAGSRPAVAAVFFRDGKLCAVDAASGAVGEVVADGTGKDPMGRLGVKGLDQDGLSVRTLDGRERFRTAGGTSPVRAVNLSADGRVLLVVRDSHRAEVYRLE